MEALRRRVLRSRPERGAGSLRRGGLRRRLQGSPAVDRRRRRERGGVPRRLQRPRRRERRRPRARRAARALPQGRRRLRFPTRGRVVHPLAHRAPAPRRHPRPRDPPARRLAARPRQLLELRAAGPARAAHGQDAAARHRGRHAAGEEASPARPDRPGRGRGDAGGAHVRARDRRPQHRLLVGRQVRPCEVPGAHAAADPGVQEAHRPDEPRSPEGREHGKRGPHPPRPARPRLRARRRRGRGGGEGARRSDRDGGARGRARRGALPVQPPLRPVQAAGRALGSRREGAGALRGEARRRGPGRRAPRRHPRRLRGLPEGPRRDAGVVGEAARGRLAARLAPVPAGAAGRAARHPGGDRRDRLSRAENASRRRQHGVLLGRPGVPGRAAADDPRGRGLPRSLAARLRRRRRGRQPRRGRLLHQRRGLPAGAHAAGARVRPDREAARLHDPRRPQLLGGEQGPPLHRRAAGPARGPRAAAAPGGPGEPQAAGGDRPGAAGAARGGGRLRSACRKRRRGAGRSGCGSTSPCTSA